MSNEPQTKPELAGLVAEIAREGCRRLYEKRLAGIEEELAAVYETLEKCTHSRMVNEPTPCHVATLSSPSGWRQSVLSSV